MSNIHEVTKDNFEGEVLRSQIPVLVDLYADWCAPCKTMSAVLDQVARQVEGKVKVVKINTDNEPELAAGFQVQALPTVVLVQAGRVVDGFVGAVPAKAVLGMIERATAPTATKT